MSADNCLSIIEQPSGSFIAWDHFVEEAIMGNVEPIFEAKSLREAVQMAQKYMQENVVEYAYTFSFLNGRSK